MSNSQKSLGKKRDFTYESDPAVLLINLHSGIPGNFLIRFGNYATIQQNCQVSGGLLTFGRRSANTSELHAIKLHETVEAPLLPGSISSKINIEQPFEIASASEFISRGLKSSSIYKGYNSVVFSSDEALRFFFESGTKLLPENVDNPNSNSVVKAISGIKVNKKRMICLYMDSGNVYAGVEE